MKNSINLVHRTFVPFVSFASGSKCKTPKIDSNCDDVKGIDVE